jgi:hypothetical protein
VKLVTRQEGYIDWTSFEGLASEAWTMERLLRESSRVA